MLGMVFVAIWTSGYVVGSIAARHADPLAVTFWRLTVAAVVLAVIAVRTRARWPRDLRSTAGTAAVGALFLGVQFGGVYLGLAGGVPAATSSLIVSSCPLLVAVVASIGGAERFVPRQWLGVLLGLAGVVLALGAHLAAPDSVGPLIWTLVGLGGFAAGTVLIPKLIPREVDVTAAATVQCLAATVVVGVWTLVSGHGVAVPLTGAALGSGAWLAFVNGVGGPLVITAIVRRHGASRSTALMFVVPAATAIVAWPVLGEPISGWTVAGLVVAAAGVVLMRQAPAERRGQTRQARRREKAPTMAR